MLEVQQVLLLPLHRLLRVTGLLAIQLPPFFHATQSLLQVDTMPRPAFEERPGWQKIFRVEYQVAHYFQI